MSDAGSVSIHTLTASELEAAERIVQAAFRTSEGRLRDLRRYLALQPDGWLLARVAGNPVGLVGITDYGSFAYVGLMAVHPAAQRRGVGSALMRRALEHTRQRGMPTVLLDATDAGAPLYAKFGFVADDAVGLYEAGPAPSTAPAPEPSGTPSPSGTQLERSGGPSPETVRPLEAGDLEAVAEFDRPFFGGSRAAVLRAMLADFPGRAFVAEDRNGAMAGYLIAQMRRLGPWVARTASAADALLRAALTLPYQGVPAAIVPGANTTGTSLVRRYGFHLVRSTRHMRLGPRVADRQRERIYGQASFTLG
jgi:predicted N-acetyltransferase YhbS